MQRKTRDPLKMKMDQCLQEKKINNILGWQNSIQLSSGLNKFSKYDRENIGHVEGMS